MSLTWNLDSVLIGAGVPRKEYMIDEKLLPPTGWARPWEALPMALHRWINWGQREYMTDSAVLYYNVDIVLRTLGTLVGSGLAFYLLVSTSLFRDTIGAGDWYLWVVLAVWWVGIGLQLMLSLWGRFERLDKTLTEQDVLDNEGLHLPMLLWNYQSFGVDRWWGLLAALLVTTWQVLYAVGWGVLLYECLTRSLADEEYEALWMTAWSFLLLQHVVGALARAGSFTKLRSITSKYNDEPNPIERGRITIACLYIFWTLALVAPLALSAIPYVAI
jgi:hypothetical protein